MKFPSSLILKSGGRLASTAPLFILIDLPIGKVRITPCLYNLTSLVFQIITSVLYRYPFMKASYDSVPLPLLSVIRTFLSCLTVPWAKFVGHSPYCSMHPNLLAYISSYNSYTAVLRERPTDYSPALSTSFKRRSISRAGHVI